MINDLTRTSSSVIGITWTEGASNGGTPIIDYRVSYKLSSDSSFTYLDNAVATTVFWTGALTAGAEYTFKVEARNSFGYSTTYSNEVTILQAQVPDFPLAFANNPAVTAESVIGLTWSPGAFDGASPVIDYRVTYD